MTWPARLILVLLALIAVGTFAIAVALDPYRDGKVWLSETHQQLGLPPCTFKRLTGWPCPSCGMSTSFALAIRGDLVHSVQANFVGTLLALFGMVFIPWSLISAARGRWLLLRQIEGPMLCVVLGFTGLMFLRWFVVLALLLFTS